MSRALPIAVMILAAAVADAAPRRGVSLGLFAEDAGWSYAHLLEEIAAQGATDVELVVPLYQEDVTATTVGYHSRFSPPLATIRRTVREARRKKLRVLLFPIVRLSTTHGPNEWRGTLRPSDRAAWLASYGDRLVELATLAKQEGAESLAIGSELSTLDVDLETWRPVVARVRAAFAGELVYSANWDHFEATRLWPLVDRIGVCGYFPLALPVPAPLPTLDALVAAWTAPATKLSALAQREHRGVVITELGYRSQPDALAEPWDEGRAAPVDPRALEAQRLGFAAFRRAFAASPSWLDGFYVWNWYGWGGATSAGYTPRGKPAAREVEQLLRGSEPEVRGQH